MILRMVVIVGILALSGFMLDLTPSEPAVLPPLSINGEGKTSVASRGEVWQANKFMSIPSQLAVGAHRRAPVQENNLLSIVLAQTTPTPVPDPVQACQQLIPEGAPGLLELDPPTVEIVAPANGDVIQGDQVAVSVETENFVLSSENHWHVWVDGQLLGMIYQPAAVLNLEPGTHQICVALSNAAHGTVSKATGIEIVVEPAAPGAATPTIPAVVGEIINEPLVDTSQIVLLVVGGVLAGIGGWWVGQRLGQRRAA